MDNTTLENIKIMLGKAVGNFSDELIALTYKNTLIEIKSYCNRDTLDAELECIAERITIIKLNRINTEGLTSQSFSGITESYVDGYPSDIRLFLNKKRKIKVV